MSPIILSASPKRIFAVGDIHGCLEELTVLLDHLTNQEGFSQEDQLIFLGDYIDRGPDSFGVVELLIDFKSRFPKTFFLRGNHEEYILKLLHGQLETGEGWLKFGGKETLESYKLPLTAVLDIRSSLPESHMEFYEQLSRYVITDKFVFVHAGLDPYEPLLTQEDRSIYWIREPFIDFPHSFRKTVVFGHTPQKEVLVDLPYKLGIDTGCVFGNALTAVEVNSQAVLRVPKGAKSVTWKTLI